jgi:UDP-N-acetylmuramyl pentapeptide phosphotransferase/UDP-N-acetylglucosamine-1-phosphate transferase
MIAILFLLFCFAVAYFFIPQIISFANKRNLVDVPDFRKVHKGVIPALGGVAVFVCFLCSGAWGFEWFESRYLYIFLGSAMIVITGIVDDIKPQKALLKLGIQIAASFIVVYFGVFRIDSLMGTFGIYTIAPWLAVLISTFIVITFINALNLIDGINGLAASLGILYFSFFAVYFYTIQNPFYVLISVSFVGSLLAFLRYNLFTPKIFLGDTGSTLIGFVSALFLIEFWQGNGLASHSFSCPYSLMASLFILPLFDTFRVAFLRILKQKSPFSPDKTHIHHLFLRLNLKHYAITGILILFNIIIFLSAFFTQFLGDTLQITILFGLIVFGFFILEFLLNKKIRLKKQEELTMSFFKTFTANYWYIFFSIIVFSLPFYRWATSIPIFIFIFFWIISFRIRNIALKDYSKYYILFPALLFFTPILYYTLFTFDISTLFHRISLTVVFLLFPLTLFLKKELFDLKKWYFILAFYLLGILTFFGISFAIFILKLLSTQLAYSELQSQYVLLSNIPPIYYALILNFGLMACIYLRKSNIQILKNQKIQFLISLFIGLNILILQSKVGFVAMMLILFTSSIIQKKQYRNTPFIFYSFLIFTVIFALKFYQPSKLNIQYLSQSSNEVSKRVMIWQDALFLVKENAIFGYGSNYMQTLNTISNLNLNAHNQFLEYLLEYGILGLIMIVCTLSFSIYMAIRSKDYFYLGFIALIIYFGMVESIFSNQTGVVFFSLFNALFLLKSRLRIKTNS